MFRKNKISNVTYLGDLVSTHDVDENENTTDRKYIMIHA